MLPHDAGEPSARAVNESLAAWGEPPTDDQELELARLLGEALERSPQDESVLTQLRDCPDLHARALPLLDVCRQIEEMMQAVLEHSGVLSVLSSPDQPAPPDLRLSVSQLVQGRWQRIASTHATPCVLRDLRRLPDSPDRVCPRTGTRVRLEVSCDRPGYVLVFNVGPTGRINLLYPFHASETGSLLAPGALSIGEIELTPPAGRERLYAVWSVSPLSDPHTPFPDMKRLQEALALRHPEHWHAILLELDHQP